MRTMNTTTYEISKKYRRIGSNIDPNSALIIGVAVIAAVSVSFFAEGFFSLRNLSNVLYQVSYLGILVLGITPVLIIAQIDLTLAVLTPLSSIIGTLIIVKTGSITLGISAILLVGISVGAFNGLIIGKFKGVSFIVTLAGMMVGNGAVALLLKSRGIVNLPAGYTWIGQGKIGVFPIPFFIYISLTIIAFIFMNTHYVGRWIYSIGTNKSASKLCGIPIDLTTFFIFVFAGLMASVSGIIASAKLGFPSASMGGFNVLLNYIAAAAIGGVSISGGKGTVLNAVFGTFIIIIISNAMTFLGVHYYYRTTIQGAIIILIVALDNIDFEQIKFNRAVKKGDRR